MSLPLRMAAWLCALAGSLLYADSYVRQPGADVQHYVFRIALSDTTDEIFGETTVTVRFAEDGVGEFALDLASAAKGKGMSVTGVATGGAPARYTHRGDRLAIAVVPASEAGELREFTVRYHGVPAGGLRIGPNQYGERTFFSDNWPDRARQWLPTVDHPYDKASSEFIVTAPAKYQVVANGRLEEIRDLGGGEDLRVTHWEESTPIASWLNCIGVAQFASRHFGTAAGAPLETWLFPKDREAGAVTFEEPELQAMEFFTERIGPYPYEKLAAVEAAGQDGGMENASAIFFGEKRVTGRPASELVWHEAAHQWFGDSVTEKDWDDVWLSEGFATYFALLAVEHYEGRDAFVASLERSRDTVFKTEPKLPDVAVIANRPWTGIPNSIVYQKGAWVLHMLRGYLGTPLFWQGIREYYHRYRDSNASTADLRKVMEDISGKDLAWFFGQWLYRAGSPALEGGWRYNAAAKKIEIELAEVQLGAVYRLPLEVAVRGAGGVAASIARIEMTAARQSFEIPAESEPAAVELDPNTWVLMDAHFTKR
jgi:aminopeptidase N